MEIWRHTRRTGKESKSEMHTKARDREIEKRRYRKERETRAYRDIQKAMQADRDTLGQLHLHITTPCATSHAILSFLTAHPSPPVVFHTAGLSKADCQHGGRPGSHSRDGVIGACPRHGGTWDNTVLADDPHVRCPPSLGAPPPRRAHLPVLIKSRRRLLSLHA